MGIENLPMAPERNHLIVCIKSGSIIVFSVFI